LNCLAISLFFSDTERSINYVDEAMKLAKDNDYQQGIAKAFRNFGHIYQYQGNYPKALNNYHEALALCNDIGEKREAGWICYDIAETHYFANNYEKAHEYANIALDIFNDKTKEGGTVGGVREFLTIYGAHGENYGYLGKFDKSIECKLIVLDIIKENNISNIELMLNTFTIGMSYMFIGEYDTAKTYFFEALSYPEENQNMNTLKYRNIMGLGWLYYDTGNLDSAIYYLSTAFDFYNQHGFLYYAMNTSGALGDIYYTKKEFARAQHYLDNAERIFNEMLEKRSWYRHDSLQHIATYGLELYYPVPPFKLREMMWRGAKFMYKSLYLTNDIQNKTKEALKYHVLYSDAKDTLNKIQRNRETIELQTRYESERKDQQIEALSLENELKETRLVQNRYFLFGSIGLLFIVVMFGYILFRQNKMKTEQKLLVSQQKLFRSQMNPHFIFNSMASIQNFIVNQDSKKANIYLSRFSELVRSILDNSVQEYIPFEKEVSSIENYLELQKVRFPDKFTYSMDVDEKIDPENMLIPPMLAQPFIENSIEHGFKHKDGRGMLDIRFTLKEKMILFEIQDDGVGRDKAQEIEFKIQKDHQSMATAITRERLTVLNKKLKQKISLSISDLKNKIGEPTGTKVVFDIPFKYI
jgi:tetratricopeptide (TPR) repeat protein